jgi:hypothetical protein
MSFNKVNKTTGGLTQIEDIPIDSTPTQGSTNAVQSGGVYAQIQTLTQQIDIDGCKNHLGMSLSNVVNNGITYQNDGNNIITANGTVTQSPSAAGGTSTYITGLVVGETYVLSGLPESTALSGSEAFIKLYKNDNSYSEIKTTGSKTLTFTYDGTNAKVIDFGIRTVGTVVTNAVFKPMICLKSLYDANPTFVPYAKSNEELTEDVSRLDGETVKIVDSGQISENSSHSFTCTNYEGYRLSIYSIGTNSIGMIVLFGKHPSVSDIRYSTFNCENRGSTAPQISVSGSTLTITTASNNCYYVIERISGT